MQTDRVQVFRFDPDVATTGHDVGSRVKVGELLGGATLGHVSLVYLDVGQHFCPPESELQQLFAVIAGACAVESEHLSVSAVRQGQAIVAEPHERCAMSATEPVAALWTEGTFDVWAVQVTREITVAPYDELWPAYFEQIRVALWPYVSDVALRIDHVGSTAVPGLAAKPVIDVDIVVAEEQEVKVVIDRLRAGDYRWRGDLGVVGREAFSPPVTSSLPEHHLYLVVEGNRAHLDHLLLRDLLREDPKAREEYATVKASNAMLANGNMDIYVAAKAALVAQLLTRARAERGLPPVLYWTPEELTTQ